MHDQSTEIGADGRKSFPSTHWGLIRDAREGDSPTGRKSLERLASLYWRPVYAHFRRKWGKTNEEAKDLTQEFFLVLTTQSFLEKVAPRDGRFRSYVMAALDNFALRQGRREAHWQTGVGAPHLPLDFEGFEPSLQESPDEVFLKEWARSVMNEALGDLEKESLATGTEVYFRLLMRHDVDPPADADLSYEELAREFGLKATDVTNYLFRARKKLREFVLSRVRETLSTETEAEQEFRELFENGSP